MRYLSRLMAIWPRLEPDIQASIGSGTKRRSRVRTERQFKRADLVRSLRDRARLLLLRHPFFMQFGMIRI